MDLAYLPLTETGFAHLCDWYNARGHAVLPPRTHGGLLVASDHGPLVGVGWDVGQQHIYVVAFATNPAAPVRHRHAAALLALRALHLTAAALGKVVVLTGKYPLRRGPSKRLAREGAAYLLSLDAVVLGPVWRIANAYREGPRRPPTAPKPVVPAGVDDGKDDMETALFAKPKRRGKGRGK